jgi:hypothetical protein
MIIYVLLFKIKKEEYKFILVKGIINMQLEITNNISLLIIINFNRNNLERIRFIYNIFS